MNAATESAPAEVSRKGTDLVRLAIIVDAIANLLAAAVLWSGSGTWASAFGLESSGPILALGALFFVNGVECWLTARRPTMPSTWLWGLAGVDFVFGVSALAIAIADPSGAESWARWVLAALADAALVIGAVKGYRAYRTERPTGTAGSLHSQDERGPSHA